MRLMILGVLILVGCDDVSMVADHGSLPEFGPDVPVVETVCDGRDEDSDGRIDEGLDGMACRAEGPCPIGQTLCRAGVLSCEVVIAAEVCDGVDNDCNGVVDERIDGVGAACATGEGGCRVEGALECDPAKGDLACNAVATLPEEERCDGQDNDCDGRADEDASSRLPCEVGIGACQRVGEELCIDGRVACDASVGEGIAERCNGLDDDCDGAVDEELGLGGVCEAGTGACAATGVLACMGDEVACDAQPGAPSLEACNGVDDDCDGDTDEDFGLGEVCTRGVGGCATAGVVVCVDGGVGCDAVAGVPGEESCNGLDDDCDDQADEDFGLGEVCTRGVGACATAGVVVCVDGGVGCDAVAGVPGEESCNGLDDDCDGQADEACFTECAGEAGPPCNGCPVGTRVPPGFVCIPQGDFVMGPTLEVVNGALVERRQATTISRPFLLAITETTQDEWFAVAPTRPSLHVECPTCPVERVSWFDAALYLNRLSERDGLQPCYDLRCENPEAHGLGCAPGVTDCPNNAGNLRCEGEAGLIDLECTGYRLPTSAEWEYAARAGTNTAFYNGVMTRPRDCMPGDPVLDRAGWYFCNSGNLSQPVGADALPDNANGFGLRDMQGNVMEWTGDWRAPYPPGPIVDVGGPLVPQEVDHKVFRGGSYDSWAEFSQPSYRESAWRGRRLNYLGFRIARSL
jgi:formylglycine-generating enzyme required for sulfatase activity